MLVFSEGLRPRQQLKTSCCVWKILPCFYSRRVYFPVLCSTSQLLSFYDCKSFTQDHETFCFASSCTIRPGQLIAFRTDFRALNLSGQASMVSSVLAESLSSGHNFDGPSMTITYDMQERYRRPLNPQHRRPRDHRRCHLRKSLAASLVLNFHRQLQVSR